MNNPSQDDRQHSQNVKMTKTNKKQQNNEKTPG